MKFVVCLCIILSAFLAGCDNGVYDELDVRNSGDNLTSGEIILDNSLNVAIEAYRNFVNASDVEGRIYSFLFLDESNIPFLLYDVPTESGIYHYENGGVVKVLGFEPPRMDRTQLCVKQNTPYILQIYNVFGEQSWKIYKYENGEFTISYDSGVYLLINDDEGMIHEFTKIYDDEAENEIYSSINKELNTIDYELEYELLEKYYTFDEAVNNIIKK